MKNIWQILTLLLATSLVVLTIKITILDADNSAETAVVEEVDASEIIINSIMTRSSVRSYTSQVVESDKVETLLRAAMAAPTAGNKQPWEFVVITDREIIDQIPPIIKGAHMAVKSQLVIAVLGNPEAALMPEYWTQDCSAAMENLLLAAHGMGLGAVWCGVYPNVDGRTDKVDAILGLPDHLHTMGVAVIGYPDSEPVVKDKWNPAKVHYNKY